MKTAITINNVSKKYPLGKIGSRYFFREVHKYYHRIVSYIAGGHSTLSEPSDTIIHALNTVTLHIAQGQTVGIIGRNGSGKSTLLKLLAGITLPSSGSIDIYGRVASLLDIGTGFQSDLSARENIFLNGAILGMNRRELLYRFNAIVDFSGIGRFIDTPVKRFSTGMYIRLACAIAIHCVADIFLIDEILSAADRSFLNQCYDRLNTYSNIGKTIVLVSHNLKTIRRLCSRTVLLSDGKITADGPTGDIIDLYCKKQA